MAIPSTIVQASRGAQSAPGRPRWRTALPILETPRALLREVRQSDASSLAAAIGQPLVQQYLPVGPTTVEGFARFIRWVRAERRAGRYLCFAVIPRADSRCAGVFQVWPVEPGFGTAEIGFALDSSYWGTGLFHECAEAVIDFAIAGLGVRRIECRSATANTRGAGALRKLGAQSEGTLRQCFPCPEGYLDHTMWSILSDEWKRARTRRDTGR